MSTLYKLFPVDINFFHRTHHAEILYCRDANYCGNAVSCRAAIFNLADFLAEMRNEAQKDTNMSKTAKGNKSKKSIPAAGVVTPEAVQAAINQRGVFGHGSNDTRGAYTYDLPDLDVGNGAAMAVLRANFELVEFEHGVELFETPSVRVDAGGNVYRPRWEVIDVRRVSDPTQLAYDVVAETEKIQDARRGGMFAFVQQQAGMRTQMISQFVHGSKDDLPLRVLHEIPSQRNPGTWATRVMLCLVEQGIFLFGSEKAQHNLDSFYCTMHPITVAQFEAFVKETGYVTAQEQEGGHCWRDPGFENGHKQGPDNPVVYVNYFDAQAWTEWATMKIPTEHQIEKAVRGNDGRQYPWGDAPPAENLLQWSGPGPDGVRVQKHGTSSVFAHPDGRSPNGILDAAGNVWVWTSSK